MQTHTSASATTSGGVFRQSHTRSTIAPCGFIIAISLTAAAYGRITIDGDAELLRQVSAAHQSNRQQLQTWQGNARFDHREYDSLLDQASPEADSIRVSSIAFAQTRSRLRSLWSDEQVKYRPQPDNVQVNTDPRFYNHMRLDDGSYRYRGRLKSDAPGNLVIFPPDDQPTYEDLNPMAMLQKDGVGQDFEQLLNFIGTTVKEAAESGADTPQNAHLTIIRTGDVVEIDIAIDRGDKGPMRDRLSFDLAQGGNLIERERQLSDYHTTINYTYEQRNGVWIPTSYAERRAATEDAAQPRSWNKKITFASDHVNQPVDDDAFTLAALGVKPGDFIVDRRQPDAPIAFRYSGGGGIPEMELARFVQTLTTEVPESQPAGQVARAPNNASAQASAASGQDPLGLLSSPETGSRRGSPIRRKDVILLGLGAITAIIAVAWIIRRASYREEQA